MKLYFVQHGHALSKEEDPGRALSPDGMLEVQSIAHHLSAKHIIPSNIYHSGKMRAHQTAEIFNDALAVSSDVIAIGGINPKDDAEAFADGIQKYDAGSMFVGHLPFMANLVSYLVTGNQEPHIIAYRPASVVCMVMDEHKNWYVGWMLRPDCIVT